MSTTNLAAFIARCRVLCRPRKHVTDAELLERFTRHRDADAFGQLLERYASLVWSVCRRILSRESDCEDAFQAVFLALVRRPDAIDPSQALGAWLHTVAVRVAHRTLTQSRRQQLQAVLPEPATGGDVADAVGSRELLRLVDEEIERLPVAVRAPLILCCLQGRTRDEAAETLGCSVAAVKSRLERGRDLLRRRLERRGVQLPAAFLVLGLTTERIRAALWAKTMQSALYTPALAIAALAETSVSAVPIGKGKLLLVVLLLASCAAGAAGTLLTEKPVEAPRFPQEKSVAVEPKKTEAPQVRRDRHGDPLPDGAIARLGTVRWRHGFFVFAVAFSPDGKKIAAIGAGRDITLWDADTGKEIYQFPNKGKQPVGLAFSPDGKTLVTSDRGGVSTLTLWDVNTGKEVRRLEKGPQGGSHGITFSPDGKTLATAGYDDTVRWWDAAAGKELRRLECGQKGLYDLALSPDGKLLATAGVDGSIRLWDPNTGAVRGRLSGHPKEAWRVVFSPDGKLLASSSEDIRLWDVKKRRQVWACDKKMAAFGPIAFSPDGTLLASGHRDGTIHLWDVVTRAEKRSWQAGSMRVFTLAFSPDGKTLASASSMESIIRLWDVATGRERQPSDEHHASIGYLRFSPDGAKLVSISRDRKILLWDLASNTPRRQFQWKGEALAAFALSPDGNTLAVGSSDVDEENEVRLWDVRTDKPGRVLGKHKPGKRIWSIAFSSDGRLVASAGEDRVIHIWGSGDGKEIRQIKGLTHSVLSLRFAPDGKTLAGGMWRSGPPSAEPTLRLWDVESGKERCSFDSHLPFGGGLAFSPDGKVLASGCGSSHEPNGLMVRLWDTATGKELCRHIGHQEQIGAVAFSPDGKLVASGSGDLGTRDNSVHVWEAATGRLIRRFEGHHSSVGSLVFSPDGLTAASGAGDSTILLWDITGRRINGRWHLKPLIPRQLDACWTALADADAAKAYDAVWALVAAPEQAVPFLQKHLLPVPRLEAKTVARLIADLDSDDFKVRQKATEELTKLGDAIAPALQTALEGKPSLEVRRRIQQLLDQTRDWTPEHLRDHRAIQALEHIGTSQARELLQKLAAGAPETLRTEEAKAALRRLAK
jgi:RNA polymerase sigma factor (sigma-70 family)